MLKLDAGRRFPSTGMGWFAAQDKINEITDAFRWDSNSVSNVSDACCIRLIDTFIFGPVLQQELMSILAFIVSGMVLRRIKSYNHEENMIGLSFEHDRDWLSMTAFLLKLAPSLFSICFCLCLFVRKRGDDFFSSHNPGCMKSHKCKKPLCLWQFEGMIQNTGTCAKVGILWRISFWTLKGFGPLVSDKSYTFLDIYYTVDSLLVFTCFGLSLNYWSCQLLRPL